MVKKNISSLENRKFVCLESNSIRNSTKYGKSKCSWFINRTRSVFLLIIFVVLLASLIYASSWNTTSQADFDEGTYYQTFYNNTDGFVQLNATYYNGTFTSQIFDAGASKVWNDISWVSNAIGELPASQAVEPSFGSGNMNMTGNTLLLHLNNDSAYGENSSLFYDFSGNKRNGTCTETGCPTFNPSGKINGAMRFDGINDNITNVALSNFFNKTVKTISVWFKPTGPTTTSSKTYNGQGIVYGVLNYIGIYRTYYLSTSTDRIWVFNYDGTADEIGLTYNTDEWMNVVLMHKDGTLYAYKNGVLNGSVLSGPTSSLANNLIIGGPAGVKPFNGTIDEVAIWNRSLSDTEILNIYKRGATRLNFSVRSCNDASCSGENFTDINDTTPQTLSLTNNQYFQYNVSSETDNVSYSPELYNVTVNYEDVDVVATSTATGEANITITSVTSITIRVQSIDFGSGFADGGSCVMASNGQHNQTGAFCMSFRNVTDGFYLENTGNLNLSLNYSCSGNCTSASFIGGTNPAFQLRVKGAFFRNVSSQTNDTSASCQSYNDGSSAAVFNGWNISTNPEGTYVDVGSFQNATLCGNTTHFPLDFQSGQDAGVIDVNVSIPTDAPATPVASSATFTFTAMSSG